MNSEDEDDRYVHDPAEFDGATGDATHTPGPADTPSADPDGMGRRGWVLLAAVVATFFGVPAAIYLRPTSGPFAVVFLLLPVLPAFLLGATAVWAMSKRRR